MTEERRGAARFEVPPGLQATLSGISVDLVELSTIGARIEHVDRFPLAGPQLRITWKSSSATIPVRIIRSEIAGRRGQALLYRTGIEFIRKDSGAEELIASILRGAEPSPPLPPPPPPSPKEVPTPQPVSLDDSWIQRVRFLKDDLEENLPYAQFRLTESGWKKSYVESPDQPEDGFTLGRDDLDFVELQRSFEYADDDTRRMMRIALETKLKTTKSG